MKELFDQFPHIFDQLFKKVEEMDVSGRPEVKKARTELMKTMRGATQELASLSEKFGQEPKTNIKPRIPATLKKKEEAKQLSFDFMNDESANNSA